MKRIVLFTAALMLVANVLQAQTLPLTVRLGLTPDTSANAPMGYTVGVDGATAVDVGLPVVVAVCRDFVGSASGPCVPFSVQVNTAGTHTVTVVGYNLGGNSPNAIITFSVSAPPGNPNSLRLVK